MMPEKSALTLKIFEGLIKQASGFGNHKSAQEILFAVTGYLQALVDLGYIDNDEANRRLRQAKGALRAAQKVKE